MRFLNLKDQIEEGSNDFAFYDTISNTILSFNGQEVFNSLDRFTLCFMEVTEHRPLSRFINLIPKDYFDEGGTIKTDTH